MAKNSYIFSPIFFGLFCLVLIAFMSEKRGVNAFTQPICPASAPKNLGYKYTIWWSDCVENCGYCCTAAYGSTSSTVVSGYCFNPRLFVIVCQCCTTTITTTAPA
ncbi:hypothetical protein MKX01_034925 [Papaver californicum]|nr:hypothetical protein MKX01_034925 [Papaver californicum]